MLEKSKMPFCNSVMPSSKFTTELNLSKCTADGNANSSLSDDSEIAGDSVVDGKLRFWPPSSEVVDSLVLKLKARDGDMEANWEKIILNFKKELAEEEQQHRLLRSSDGVVVNNGGSSGDGIERQDRGGIRAKFSVPLSRREVEKDFEDMGERRLPRKPRKRPKIIQNKLDTIFPGLWLTEINADLYRVPETKKR